MSVQPALLWPSGVLFGQPPRSLLNAGEKLNLDDDMYNTFSIILLFSVLFILGNSEGTEECLDRNDYCRYLKTFCKSEDHKEIMRRECAATCSFCSSSLSSNSTSESNSTENLALRRRRENSTETTPKKCVFPKEKMLTSSPLNETEISFNANVSLLNRANETVQTVIVQLKNTTRLRPVPNSNEILKKLAQSKRNETVRKVTLDELVGPKDLVLPRITTAKPTSFSVSLAKTLIKGKCFDEYMYCREFATLCTHPTFGDVMASHCTLTCKRCDDVEQDEGKDDENCADESPDCEKYGREMCHDERYAGLTRKHCAKTCGHCKPACRDRHQNCQQFAVDGFCSDEMYSEDERKYLCGATCGACK